MLTIRGITVRTGMVAVALMALAAVIFGSDTVRTSAAGTATLSVSPGPQIVAPGATFNVNIDQNARVTTTGVQATLTFDRTYFEVVDVQIGTGYSGAAQTVGESVSAGADAFPYGFGLSETGASCTNSSDDDGDARANDGCSARGAAEVACSGSTDDDFDGRANDGCAVVGIAEKNQCGTDAIDDDLDGVTEINDGCPAVGVAESGYQCTGTPLPVNSVDDDADGTTNDGCPVRGGVEAESDCVGATDNDGDGRVNDGCPANAAPEVGGGCLDALDNDSDLVFNDGCEGVGGTEQAVICQGAIDEDGDTFFNDGCAAFGTAEAGPACVALDVVDNDGDNRVNDGCPASGTAENAASTICEVGLAGVDTDGDGLINDGCAQINTGETGVACDNAIDDDADEAVNDGCAAAGSPEVQQCSDTIDNDSPVDGFVNDGCGAFGLPEVGGQCVELPGVDDDGDGFINDGCPRTGGSETGGQCADTIDNDGDLLVNDGCPETGGQCGDGLDSDGDLVADDGCYPPNESGVQCDNYVDDDADGLINDGCTATEPAAIEKANNATGVLVQPSVFFVPGLGSVPSGAAQAIVIVMKARSVPCGATSLALSNISMLDNLGDPGVTVTLGATSYVGIDDGIGASDLDCEGVLDSTDNCDFTANVSQQIDDGNFIDLSPPKTFDDTTWANADTSGNACDDDDDNDGLTDTAEAAGCNASGPLNPIARDTDLDRFLDGAECALGTNPADILSKPAVASCGATTDGDLDGLSARNEFCFYNTSDANANTDGDICSDGREVASVNAGNAVNAVDLSQVAQTFGAYTVPATAEKYNFDYTKDQTINAIDLSQIAQRFGTC